MSSEKTLAVAALGNHIARVIAAIDTREGGLYPVLGAEGRDFFIEIAVGSLESRRILKTIHIKTQNGLEHPVLPNMLSADDEVSIIIPNASLLIALVGLLQLALKANALILHPLDDRGDFLPGWNDAVMAASSGMPS